MTELEEGAEGEFWQDVMGQDEYASANVRRNFGLSDRIPLTIGPPQHWRFKRRYTSHDKADRPRVFSLTVEAGRYKLSQQTIGASLADSESVFVIELAFELYVIVPQLASRTKRDVHAALNAAQIRSAASNATKPFKRPVHVLLLPTVVPLDLSACFRVNIFGEPVSETQQF